MAPGFDSLDEDVCTVWSVREGRTRDAVQCPVDSRRTSDPSHSAAKGAHVPTNCSRARTCRVHAQRAAEGMRVQRTTAHLSITHTTPRIAACTRHRNTDAPAAIGDHSPPFIIARAGLLPTGIRMTLPYVPGPKSVSVPPYYVFLSALHPCIRQMPNAFGICRMKKWEAFSALYITNVGRIG